MGTWKSRGLRGSTLEDMINRSNEIYREKNLALIQKIPTPITPITIDKESRHITLAYFDQKSTVDYIGAIQGIPVCFDAKECAAKTFPLQNVHLHQMMFPFRRMYQFWKRMENGGRKSFTYEEIDPEFRVLSSRDILVHYLAAIQRDLDLREGE